MQRRVDVGGDSGVGVFFLGGGGVGVVEWRGGGSCMWHWVEPGERRGSFTGWMEWCSDGGGGVDGVMQLMVARGD
ncbi:hypothetical protein VNO80_25279 [Phaseolus coccineus]|uniref:Uncharacterized protein n=1 Tax=Phaseolus coccineus TaxID=3886 RepID=A0AAN9LUI9_PHACN